MDKLYRERLARTVRNAIDAFSVICRLGGATQSDEIDEAIIKGLRSIYMSVDIEDFFKFIAQYLALLISVGYYLLDSDQSQTEKGGNGK